MAETYIKESVNDKTKNNFLMRMVDHTYYGILLDKNTIRNVFSERNHNDYKHFNKPGLYIIWGYAEDNRIRVYAGESSQIIVRLNNHLSNRNNKKIWEEIGFSPEGAFIVINDQLTKDSLHYSEKELIDYLSYDLGNIDRNKLNDKEYQREIVCLNNCNDISKKENIIINHTDRIICDNIIEHFKEYIEQGFGVNNDLINEINDSKKSYINWKNPESTIVSTTPEVETREFESITTEKVDNMTNTVVSFEEDFEDIYKQLKFIYNDKAITITSKSSINLYKSFIKSLLQEDKFAEANKFAEAINNNEFITSGRGNTKSKPFIINTNVHNENIDGNYISIDNKYDNYKILYSQDNANTIRNRMINIFEFLDINHSSF